MKRAVTEAAGPVDGPWTLPEGWRWERLCSISDYISRGRSPRYVENDGITVLNQRCVRWHGIELQNAKLTDRAAAARLDEAQVLLPGDILWNSTGTGTIGRATVFPDHLADQGIVADSHITIVRPSPHRALPSWINYWIGTSGVQKAVAGTGSTNQVELSRALVVATPVPVPPLDTQRRIVGRIDDLFAELDDGETALARARADFEIYRKALLKAAVTGELTADWRAANPPTETGDQLLQLILAERKARWQAEPKNRGKRYKDPVPIDADDLTSLPVGWTWASLDQLAWGSGYGTSAKCELSGEGEAVLRIPNLRDGGIDLADLKYSKSMLGLELGDYLAPGDLLIVRTNGSRELIGRAGIVADLFGTPTHFASYLIRFRIVDLPLLFRWVRLFTDAALFRANVLASIGSSAGQYNLSLSKLNGFPIAVPPSREVLAILDAVAAAELQWDQPASPASTLRQSILAAAFRGELIQ